MGDRRERDAERQDRIDRQTDTELAFEMQERIEERARLRRQRLAVFVHHEDEHPIDPSIVRY